MRPPTTSGTSDSVPVSTFGRGEEFGPRSPLHETTWRSTVTAAPVNESTG
jgi:hypothetical protein